MKIERIKKSHKKEIVIGGLILVSIVSAITLVTTRAKYKVTQNIKLVNGTVNYKPYDFKIMAMYQQNDSGEYTEITDRMSSSGYAINEEKSYCTLDNKNKDTSAKLYTYQGKHVFENLAKSDKCYIWFDKKPMTISDIIAGIAVKDSLTTFGDVATTDEGVYKVSDGMYGGTSYYWRGAVTNNYVKFAGFCWRIIRINGDGSIRLIYDGNACHANGESTTDSIAVISQVYNTNSDDSAYVGWTYTKSKQRPTNNITATASNAKIQTENWFNDNSNFNDAQRTQVATGKFCNDRNVGSGTWSANGTTQFSYGASKRKSAGTPTLSCSNEDVYELKVGAITSDEIIYAGGWNSDNNSYYLYNGQYYWTMSPSWWYGASGVANVKLFMISSSGSLNADNSTKWTTEYSTFGLRPVINLKADTTFATGGNGTQNNPYIVE